MDGFTIIDGVVAGVIALSALLAYARGIVREGMAIVGWIAAIVLAVLFAGPVKPLIKEIPGVGPIIGDSCELATIVAAGVVLAGALLVVSLFTPLLSSLIHRSVLGGLDQALGFAFGVVRGVFLVTLAFFVYEIVDTSQSLPMVDDSRSAQVFGRITGKIQESNPDRALGWITSQYESLVSSCGE